MRRVNSNLFEFQGRIIIKMAADCGLVTTDFLMPAVIAKAGRARRDNATAASMQLRHGAVRGPVPFGSMRLSARPFKGGGPMLRVPVYEFRGERRAIGSALGVDPAGPIPVPGRDISRLAKTESNSVPTFTLISLDIR